MKIKCIITLYALLICSRAFSQSDSLAHRSIEYRYNTVSENYTYIGGDYPKYPTYYFFGFDDYSEAIMWESIDDGFWTLQLKSERNQFETFGGGFSETRDYQFKIPYYTYNLQNNQMVSFRIGSRISYNIENNADTISIDTRDETDGTMPPRNFTFYNISQEQILKIYLTNFLKGIDYILDKEWLNNDIALKDTRDWRLYYAKEKEYTIADIGRILNGLTKRELSVFRNYMFARHNYEFRTKTWNDFFREYYNIYYTGTKTNDEIMANMTEYERTILNMITEIEQKK
jgi:hypothetical protein